MNIEIKQSIQRSIVRADGKLNSAVIRRDAFKASDLYHNILDLTSFLSDSCSFSERVYCILSDITSVQYCEVCKDRPKAFSPSAGCGYSKTCGSPSCKTTNSSKKRLTTLYAKYGAAVSPKTREAARARAQRLNEKGRNTLTERYGVTNPGQLATHKPKVGATLQTKYGVNHVWEIPSTVEKIQSRRKSSFQQLCDHIDVTDVVKRVEDGRQLYSVSYSCHRCGHEGQVHGETYKWRVQNGYSPCDQCSGFLTGSAIQLELYNWILSILPPSVTVKYNDRTLLPNGREIDILIPSKQVAIEVDGLFWHSFNHPETPDEKRRHISKTIDCEQAGYRLIHIFEDELVNNPDVVKSRLAHYLGATTDNRIYARTCRVVEISSEEARQFFNRTHIQYHVPAKVTYGLEKDGKLVAAMSFGTPRYSTNADWELLRFSTDLNTSVVGGASKLFNHFVRTRCPQSVVSYANRRWSSTNDAIYHKLGFQLTHVSQPNYYYFKSQDGLKLQSRQTFQKHKLSKILKSFDPSLSEPVNMFNNGYRRIWDCGNCVFMWPAN